MQKIRCRAPSKKLMRVARSPDVMDEPAYMRRGLSLLEFCEKTRLLGYRL